MVASLTVKFEGLAPKASWGETSLYYNPGGILPNGVYFCTVKDHDGANDAASNLDRPGVYRVALGLPRERYEQLFGPRPLRPVEGGVVDTGHDVAAIDVLTPHPVYAWMGWVQVLSPSATTFAGMGALFDETYEAAVTRFGKHRAGKAS